MRHENRVDLRGGWKFFMGDPKDAHLPGFDDSSWRTVTLPHDFSIEQPPREDAPAGNEGGYFPGGTGWYRRELDLRGRTRDSAVRLIFEGAYRHARIWINGYDLGTHCYGYSEFTHEIAPYLSLDGINCLAVRTGNTDQPNCRWYTGSGLYRPVWLEVTAPLRLRHDGVCITTRTEENRAEVRVALELDNPGGEAYAARVRILSPEGIPVAETETVLNTAVLNVYNPLLWSVETPHLYTAEITLQTATHSDKYIENFGIRSVSLDAENGLRLNGKLVKLKGVCLHHDCGCLGAAALPEVWERRLSVLKSLGCNAVRTSHNPALRSLLDLCDRMGFLVLSEFYDKWGGHTNPEFEEWYPADVPAMVRRDRNHPSVFMWSIGNEEGGRGGQGAPGMVEMAGTLADLTRKTDPTRPVTYAMHPHNDKPLQIRMDAASALGSVLDVISCNYMEPCFERIHEENPHKPVCSTEAYPFFNGSAERGYGFRSDNPYLTAERLPYCIGHFIWAGVDYLGEGALWPSKGWAASPVDTAGFIKPRAYILKSLWSKEPCLHLAPLYREQHPNREKPHWSAPAMVDHWNLRCVDDEIVEVLCFTNCDEAELFLNGTWYGRLRLADFPDRLMRFYVPYAPGELTAVGYKNGREAARNMLRTHGSPATVELTRFQSGDIIQVEAVVTDENGLRVADFDGLLEFCCDGAALLGADNGDLEYTGRYGDGVLPARYGRAYAVFRGNADAAISVKLIQ